MPEKNIKELYPDCNDCCLVDIPEEVLEALKRFERKEEAYERKVLRYKAYYSLDCNDGIEGDAMLVSQTPEDIYEQKLYRAQLYAAIQSLPKKEAFRIYAYFFMGMNSTEIARTEGVSRKVVWKSIKQGLRRLQRYLSIE